jgi:hypothetical protein
VLPEPHFAVAVPFCCGAIVVLAESLLSRAAAMPASAKKAEAPKTAAIHRVHLRPLPSMGPPP